MKALTTTLGILILMSAGCRSVEKMIDLGDFDQALMRSVRKIAGKENLNKKYVISIEEAFKKATSRDMNLVEQIYHSDEAIDWSRAIALLEKIEKRQRAVQPFLPLVAKDGYQADFAFVKTTELKKSAIDHFLEYTYRDGVTQLKRGRSNNRAAAREAYAIFDQLWKYSHNYLDGRELQDEARSLGISHVAVEVVNETNQYIAASLLDQIAQQSFASEKWITYHFNHDTDDADRKIRIVLNDLDIGPEQIREVVYTDARKIEDGFEYVLDKNGNVAKDTLGNDIKIALFKNIRANVIKIHQQKTAMILGQIINQNLLTGEVDYVPFDSELVFEHLSASFRGDRRALSAESKQLIEAAPLPFPEDRQMVYDLMQTLQPILGNRIKASKLLV
jgi:hypothetical protein